MLDLSRLLPGPWCSQLLADLGADVIKIETPTAGDYARMAPAELGFGGVFESVNRGKRSVAVNYRLPAGREVVLRLAQDSDVFLESSRPGQLARRGLGPIDVRLVNPRIVYCSLSGYGQTGPYRDRPGHDLDFLAVAGLLGLLNGVEGPPEPPGIQVADLAGGTLAALENRSRRCWPGNGQGRARRWTWRCWTRSSHGSRRSGTATGDGAPRGRCARWPVPLIDRTSFGQIGSDEAVKQGQREEQGDIDRQSGDEGLGFDHRVTPQGYQYEMRPLKKTPSQHRR